MSWADAIIVEIDGLNADYSQTDWDGYGAEPLGLVSVADSKAFVAGLAKLFPDRQPDVAVDPDGCVSLDWFKAVGPDGKVPCLSVSIGPGPTLCFAYLDQGRGESGSVPSDGEAIPAGLAQAMESFFQ